MVVGKSMDGGIGILLFYAYGRLRQQTGAGQDSLCFVALDNENLLLYVVTIGCISWAYRGE